METGKGSICEKQKILAQAQAVSNLPTMPSGIHSQSPASSLYAVLTENFSWEKLTN